MNQEDLIKPFRMIEASEILDVEGILFNSWTWGSHNSKDHEVVLRLEHTDSVGQVFEQSFTKSACKKATLKENFINIFNNKKEKIEIACYSLTPTSL